MSIESVIKHREDVIKKYPSLIIDLTEAQIQAETYSYHTTQHSEHQITASIIAAKQLGWMPNYLLEVSAMLRPKLLPEWKSPEWIAECEKWEHEHSISVEELALEYIEEFERIGVRLLEPLAKNKEGLLMSYHDLL